MCIVKCSIILQVKNEMALMDRTYEEKRPQIHRIRGYDPHYSETFIKDDREDEA